MLALSKLADVPLGSCTAHIHAHYIVRSSSLLGAEQVLGWERGRGGVREETCCLLCSARFCSVLLAGHKSRDF